MAPIARMVSLLCAFDDSEGIYLVFKACYGGDMGRDVSLDRMSE